jgi:uncharacterized protein (DUF3084 family)
MVGVRIIFLLAIMGGAIAFMGDKLGSKIGKKRLTVFGLRPHYTSVLITILTGIMVAASTMAVITASSQEARTALFGMKQIREEIKNLKEERDQVLSELNDRNAKIKSLDEQIKSLDAQAKQSKEELAAANSQRDAAVAQKAQAEKEVAALQERYAAAQAQVTSAEAAKAKLQGDVTELEKATKKLQDNMVAVREGNVVYRNGEIIFAGVLKSGLNAEDNKRQLDTFLATANSQVLSRMNVKNEVQAIWLAKEAVEEALRHLHESKTDMYVRVCASGNVVSGELAPAVIEMAPNKKIYDGGDVILRQSITVTPYTNQVDIAVLAALQDVNREAQKAGVVPDPITGKVGAIQSSDLSKISEEISKKGGKVEIVAKARGDIMVAGPVLLDVSVVQRI